MITDDLRDLIATSLIEAFCVKPREAQRFARGIVYEIIHRYNGEQVYISKTDRTARDRNIRATYDGSNADALCQLHNITRRTLFRIVSEKGKAP